MKTLIRNTFILLVAIAGLAFAPAPAAALTWDTYLTGRADGIDAAQTVTTNGQIGLRIRTKLAASTGASIVCDDSTGDLTFTTDGTTADTTLGDGDAATTDGKIDVSDAAYNTFGEVCDDINASTNWQCVIVAALPSDSINNVLTTFAETGATGIPSVSTHGIYDDEGAELTINLADIDAIAVCIGPQAFSDDLYGTEGNNFSNRIANPLVTSGERPWFCELLSLDAVATFSGGSAFTEVYFVKGNGASAISQKVWSKAGAANDTATSQSWTASTEYGLRPPAGWHIVVKYAILSTPTATAGTINVLGRCWQ